MGKYRVKCKLCGKNFKEVNNFHLASKHGILTYEYRVLFPNTPLRSLQSQEWITRSWKAQFASLSPEQQQNRIKAMQAKTLSPEVVERRKASLRKVLHKRWKNLEWRNQMLATLQHNPEVLRKKSLAMMGRTFDNKTIERFREAATEQWKNPKIRRKMIRNILASRKGPNKLEANLQEFLDRYFPNEWKFVGNGDLIIGRRCPDFVNINGRKIVIELFGEPWHNDSEVKDKIAHYKKWGYNCIVIWTKELRNKETLLEKLHFVIRSA